jgi:hypothetical protein
MPDLKTAYDSHASNATIAAIENDINEILYSDRPDELNKIRIQAKFNPFSGYGPDDIKYFMSSNMATEFNKILYANYSNIWGELERENENPWIYDMEENKIWELLKKKVDLMIQNINDLKKQSQLINFALQNEK